ncbi:MAG: hypothetical protein ACTHMR_08695, partial [Thermomicrobiales bacterium]
MRLAQGVTAVTLRPDKHKRTTFGSAAEEPAVVCLDSHTHLEMHGLVVRTTGLPHDFIITAQKNVSFPER